MYAAPIAEAHPDRLAIIMASTGQTVTYAAYEHAANQFAHLLREAGLRRGDHVAFLIENNPRLLECEAGAERIGLYYTCVNHHLSAEEAAYIIDDCQARVVVTSAAKANTAAELPAQCPRVERWLMVDVEPGDPRAPAPYEPYDTAVAGFPGTPVDEQDQGAPMMYSSGTTGRPKGILLALPNSHPSVEPLGSAIQRGRWQLDDTSTYLCPAPLYHSAPQGSLSMSLRCGATAVVMESFDPRHYLELVQKHRITHSQLVPTMFSRLLKLPEDVRQQADVSSLRTVILSAAPCPPEVKAKMIEWWGPIIMEFYAASESIGYTMCTSTEWLEHPGTVGRAVMGTVLIRADDGAICPPGTIGTVWFQGESSFQYFNDPEKTASTRDPAVGASTVGDIGYLDEEGFLYLTDRKTFMIISGGVNIYPQETENLLVTHPLVDDAAVIGIPDEDLGESVLAVIQPAPGVTPGPELEQTLIAFCRDHLAHYKCPRAVDFVTELPRLPTGKLYKAKLREKYWGDRATRII